MFLNKPSGISLLVPTQDVVETIDLCLRSFERYADEIIVVDNGSTDGTIDVVKAIAKKMNHLTFHEVPHLKDLYENRQYAFEKSRFSWVTRIDSDYIAHTDGEYDIRKLRDRILSTRRTLRPMSFTTMQINLFGDFAHTGPQSDARDDIQNIHVPPPITRLQSRVVQAYPGMRFCRRGRWEGVRWQEKLRHERLEVPYWFHCTLKSKLNHFVRSERTNWRELGDFSRFPTREDYIKHIIFEKYGTHDFEEAAELHWQQHVRPFVVPYDASFYYPLPKLLREAIESGDADWRVRI